MRRDEDGLHGELDPSLEAFAIRQRQLDQAEPALHLRGRAPAGDRPGLRTAPGSRGRRPDTPPARSARGR